MTISYETEKGVFYHGDTQNIISSPAFQEKYNQSFDLIFTSPPFPLQRKKKYGNLEGQKYVDWIASFANIFKNLLKPQGSIVMEIGNTWNPASPTMSTLPLRALLSFLDEGQFHLCQQFVWNNPAKLPTPAQWVNIERIRVKDAFTHIWWMAPLERPKANNRNILTEYSESMKKLLSTKKYNSGSRPSEHQIGKESFLKDNGGAIPSSVLTYANTRSNSKYLNYCRENELPLHPARMPKDIPDFFINFLTEPNDIVLDPFAGSNTTGASAEKNNRRWVAIEIQEDYIIGSKGWFIPEKNKEEIIIEDLKSPQLSLLENLDEDNA